MREYTELLLRLLSAWHGAGQGLITFAVWNAPRPRLIRARRRNVHKIHQPDPNHQEITTQNAFSQHPRCIASVKCANFSRFQSQISVQSRMCEQERRAVRTKISLCCCRRAHTREYREKSVHPGRQRRSAASRGLFSVINIIGNYKYSPSDYISRQQQQFSGALTPSLFLFIHFSPGADQKRLTPREIQATASWFRVFRCHYTMTNQKFIAFVAHCGACFSTSGEKLTYVMSTKAKREKYYHHLCHKFWKQHFSVCSGVNLRHHVFSGWWRRWPFSVRSSEPAGDFHYGTYLFVRIVANPGVVFPKSCVLPAPPRVSPHISTGRRPLQCGQVADSPSTNPCSFYCYFRTAQRPGRGARALSKISRSRHLSNESATRAPDWVDNRRGQRARRDGITRSE